MLLVPFVYLVFHLFDAERDRPKPDLSRNFAIPMGPQVGKVYDREEFVNPAHVTPTGPGTWVTGITGDPADECDCSRCTGPEAA